MAQSALPEHGRLTAEWLMVDKALRSRGHADSEIEIVRLAYYFGAHVATEAGMQNFIALPLLMAEIRDVQRALNELGTNNACTLDQFRT